MFDMLTGKYKNLASKGRNGDTMLAHINPQEAALLKSMGGAGTINPQTGLREFYGTGQLREMGLLPKPAPLPAFGTTAFENLRSSSQPSAPAPYNFTLADTTGGGMGSYRITGYTLPTDKTFQDKPLVAKVDAQGNFKFYTMQGADYLVPDPSQPTIISQPKLNAQGEVIDYGVVDLSKQDSGGFGSMISELGTEFAPMIAAAIGANLLAPAAGAAGAAAPAAAGGAASAAGALSPYAAQAAGAYGGSAAAAQAAAAGSLAGIQAASAAQNALNLGIPTGGGVTTGGQDITQLRDQLANTPMPTVTSGPPIAGEVVEGALPEIAAETTASASDIAANDALAKANRVAQAAGGFTPAAATGLLSSLGDVGTAIMDFAKANPSIAGSLLGAVTGAIGASNAPKEQTATTSIDPQIKAEYLANLERAKTTAAGLTARQFEGFTPSYLLAETQAQNLGLGGAGQRTTDEATRLAMIEAGFTPQQIQAAQANRQNIQNTTGQLGSQYMSAYQNPFEEQVVQGALGDIERARLMQEQSNRAQAISARAFGGSRQGVVSGMTNEAALRQAATTGAQLRQAGFSAAAQLGQSDAARQLQAQMANQGVDISIEQANAQLRQQAALANQGAFAQGAGIRQAAIGQLGQLGAQQQNLGLTGANAVMEAQLRQQALAQLRLDAARNLGTERLAITGGALGLQPANVGQTSTQPLYSSTAGSLLSGGLTGAYIGSLLGK